MSQIKLLSGRVPVTPLADVPSDRYQFLGLSEAEPSLGAGTANSVLSLGVDGTTRVWTNNPNLTTVTATGNINAQYFIGNGHFLTHVLSDTANTVVDAAQPNITSVGTLTSLDCSGNITANGTITANFVHALANVTVDNTVISNNIQVGNVFTTLDAKVSNLANITGTLLVSGNVNTTNSANVTLGPVANIHISGGSANYVLSTNGSGTLSWQAIAAQGANTQVQYNDNGNFAGASGLNYDKTTGDVTVTANLTANTMTLGAGTYEFARTSVYSSVTSGLTPVNIYSLDAANVIAVDYTIISTDAAGGIREFSKISSTLVGSALEYIEHSSLQVNGNTGEYAVQYAAGPPAKINIICTPYTANTLSHKMTITVYYE